MGRSGTVIEELRFSDGSCWTDSALVDVQGVPEYMTQFQNFIKNKQVKIQRKLKYFLKGNEMPFQFSSLLQVVLKIVSLKWRPPMSMQF